MTEALRVGTLGDHPLFAALFSRRSVRAATAAEPADVWVVWSAAASDGEVARLLAASAPIVVLAAPEDAPRWLRRLRRGEVDVAWLPSSEAELVARVLGRAALAWRWTPLADALTREVAHDLRSSIQSLGFVTAVLHDDTLGDGPLAAYGEDVRLLRRVTHTLDLAATSIGNLGHHPQLEGALRSDDATDIVALLRAFAGDPAFGGRVRADVGGSLLVRGGTHLHRRIWGDVLRVASARVPGVGQVRVDCAPARDRVGVWVSAPAYEAMLDHLDALGERALQVQRRRAGASVPRAGFAFARDAIEALGGSLHLRRGVGDVLEVEALLAPARADATGGPLSG